VIGATLDRNGLRPGRWMETTDGLVILGSEAGILPIPPIEGQAARAPAAGQAVPARPRGGRIVPDAEVKHEVATRRPYGAWFDEHTVHFDQIPLAQAADARASAALAPARLRLLARGHQRDAADDGAGGRGADRLDGRRHLPGGALRPTPTLFNYFKQLFAQVTNPPIDPIREDIVMSIGAGLGAEGNLLEETPEHAHQLVLDQPILRNHELQTLRTVTHDVFKPRTIDITWPVAEGPDGSRRR
jgi:hypothetical protein